MVTRAAPGPSTSPARPGHSLPELVVALVFLGASLTAMASTAVLATRWTGDAVARQTGLAVAEAVLDSLTRIHDPPVPGSGELERWAIEWSVDSAGPAAARILRVTVRAPGGDSAMVGLDGLWVALPPGPLP